MKNNKMKIVIMLLLAVLQTASLFAGNTITFGYDAAGNRNEVDSPYGCPCECPPNKDSWLTLISERDTDDTECGLTTCKITHILDIPAEYDCYTHYVVEDGTTTTHIAPLPANKQLALISLDLKTELFVIMVKAC